MPAPYNYGIQTPDFQGQFLQGLKFLDAIEQQKAAQEQARRRQDIFTNLAALGDDVTAEDISKAAYQLPDDAEMLRKNWEMMGEAKKEALYKAGTSAYIAPPDKMQSVLEEWAAGAENSGDKELADQLRTAAKIAEHDPRAAKNTVGTILAMADPERFSKLGERTATIQNWEYFKNELGPDEAKRIVGADDDVMTNLPNGGFYAGPRSGLKEVISGLSGQALPTVNSTEEYDKVAPGSAYLDPDGKRRFKPLNTGGPTPQASAAFPAN